MLPFLFLRKNTVMANKLGNQSSPYLIQHAANPVDWYPWGDEAFEVAKQHNKPVLVSIGYATCHWCHVMERESFENHEVAAYMNEHFICIKVDREEHPDVDHFYMDALMSMQQSGGWPLNMFTTPERLPFYGGTYFPPQRIYNRPSWMEILEAVHLTWEQKSEDVYHQSEQLRSFMSQANLYETSDAAIDADIDTILQNVSRYYDSVNGGFSTAPKFPQFNLIRLLLQIGKSYANVQAVDMAIATLQKMLTSGIYDVVGGGLCRYATDAGWKIPHFEKMLYDNALFITTMAQAYTFHKDKKFQHAIEQTLAFCNTTFMKDGMYMSALDADSDGEEGKYYVWDYNILATTDGFHPAVVYYFGITEEGNWEVGKNILHAEATDEAVIEKFQLLPKQWEYMKQQFLVALWHKRQERSLPITDTKILLHQNALMVTALFQAYKALGNENYKTSALTVLDTLLKHFTVPGFDTVYHVYYPEVPQRIAAKLDGVVYLQQALIQAFSVTNEQRYLDILTQLIQYVFRYFEDEEGTLFYFSDKRQTDIAVRKIELADGALLASNAILCENLWWYGQFTNNLHYTDRARQMMQSQCAATVRYPVSYASWVMNIIRLKQGWSVVKKNTVLSSFEHHIFYNNFLEQKMIFSGYSEGIPKENGQALETGRSQNEFLECNEGSCKMPVNTVFEVNL